MPGPRASSQTHPNGPDMAAARSLRSARALPGTRDARWATRQCRGPPISRPISKRPGAGGGAVGGGVAAGGGGGLQMHRLVGVGEQSERAVGRDRDDACSGGVEGEEILHRDPTCCDCRRRDGRQQSVEKERALQYVHKYSCNALL